MPRSAHILPACFPLFALGVASAAPAPDPKVASSTLAAEQTTVWVGQVFELRYALEVNRRANPQISPKPEWHAPLVLEEWSKPSVTETVNVGERRLRVDYTARAFATAPGTVNLEPVRQTVAVQRATAGDGVMRQSRMEQIETSSNPLELEVRALPDAPADFCGAVGEFRLTSTIVPRDATVGEPITWTLAWSGTGNWPAIAGLPPREVSSDFTAVQPMHKRTRDKEKLFDVTLTEDVVLLPSKPGHYALPAISVTYFDPRSGAYKTITAPGATVNIGVAAPGSSPAAATPETSGGAEAKTRKVGGTREKTTSHDDALRPELAQPRADLEVVRANDSPARLFEILRRSDANRNPTPVSTAP